MKTAYILGAGIDRALGLPLADGLLRELDSFAKKDGKDVSQAIKNKLGGGRRVSFSFEKYVSNQPENFAERVLSDPDLASRLEGALGKVGDGASASASAVQTMIEKLRTIREANELDELTSSAITSIAGESVEMADQTMLRIRGVTLNPTPRNAMLRIFREAQSVPDLSDGEQEALDQVVTAMTNFEELLTEKFAGFYTGKSTEIRNYLYIAWMLWVYMRWKSFSAESQISDTPNFYKRLDSLDADDCVVTFNYTLLGNFPSDRTVRFHGDCMSYFRHDRGELIPNEAVTEAQNLEDLKDFFDGLDMDIEKSRIYLPGVVPPSAMKPVINREFIRRWSRAEQLMDEADLLVAVGYGFNPIDSHFNDLFRSTANGKRVAVINPDLQTTRATVCSLLGVDPVTLSAATRWGYQVERSDNLLFVPARCEEVTEEMLSEIRGGW